ncbi:DMT family transporter [Candidatus Aminicenantes bacterium AC-335-A11]|jgi:drug/metabolite transporter (DMT)-like permease|nr:DMT family transporter [SCandidatus Aminicenantes bacterium Aminicenantia_JdfR_composite]MCP2619099.1 DMT family transporter [Candidatus Aminicenantes bacterium AC-335-A11]
MTKRSLFEIHFAVLLFGLAGLFGKWIPLPSVIIVLGRVFFASISLGIFLLITKERILAHFGKTYFLLGLLGVILSFHWISFFQSIKVSTVAIGLLSYSSFPIFTSFLEPLILKEKFKLNYLFISIIAFTGIFIIIPKFEIADRITQGVLWGLASGLSFSFLSIINRKLSQEYSSLIIAFFQDSIATLLLFPAFLFLKPLIKLKILFLLAILGVFCTALSHTLFIKGMKYIRARSASIISTLEPIYGIIFAILLLGEIPNFRTIIGGLFIISSAFIVSIKK